jgi:hypothetical protein
LAPKAGALFFEVFMSDGILYYLVFRQGKPIFMEIEAHRPDPAISAKESLFLFMRRAVVGRYVQRWNLIDDLVWMCAQDGNGVTLSAEALWLCTTGHRRVHPAKPPKNLFNHNNAVKRRKTIDIYNLRLNYSHLRKV